jgi:chromosome segregation ATPase
LIHLLKKGKGMSEERFERIEATLERVGDQLAALARRQEESQAQFEALAQRQEETQAQLDGQIPVIAELRTSIEVLRNAIESERAMTTEQRAMTTELRQTAEALLGVAQIHQRDIEALASAFQQHRSDGHGADPE